MDLSLDADDLPVAVPQDGAARQRKYRRENKERAYAVRTKYRREQSKWETDASYLSHPFVAWDGEGITHADGRHDYVMLAGKTETDGVYIGRPEGLSTAECFELILEFAERVRKTDPRAIHVIYGGGYDANMMFRDLPRESVDKLYHAGTVRWNGYRIMWRPGKSLFIGRCNEYGRKIGKGVTLYDVVSFFQCPFVRACDDYLGSKFYKREMVAENKALRSSFTEEDIPEVKAYNDAELVNLIALMKELRSRLNRCGLRPRRWDGPGAIAASLLLRENVKDARRESPPDIARAARHAYAGGRFEVIQFGQYDGAVWEYDVNSAYPSALRNVPDLTAGRWRRVKGDPGPQEFALYHVRYRGYDASIPGAFFRRDPNGTICYPMAVTGWYWSPEVETGRRYCAAGHGEMEVIEAYVFVADEGAAKPFDFIDPLYLKRQALKRAKDGAHVGIKLALNSLYGKLAQQIGARQNDDGTWRIPPFHQLEWAGYTTSWCRAAVLGAVLNDLDAVVAFETDAVFVTRPLDVQCGTALGDFEPVEFERLTYVQSGMYFGVSEGKEVAKTRGVDRGSLTHEMVLEKLRARNASDRFVESRLTRFVGAGIALSQSWDRWRRWETMPKRLTLEPTGKRVHMGCECMRKMDGKGLAPGWHRTACPMMNDAHSEEFPIMWINPNPQMSELEEMRQSEVIDYE